MNDERRAHPRNPADLETVCHLVNSQGPGSRIRVRDVSRGGINFLIAQEILAGTLVRIDLPRPTSGGETIMLACVMHCVRQNTGDYAVGCAFSDELGDNDLQEFGGRREPSRDNDKRAWKRFSAQGFAEFSTLPSSFRGTRKAQIANISPNGIGLHLEEKIDPGVILDLRLEKKAGGQFDILACVVYLGTHPEGGWIAGCHFIRELEESDIQLFV